MLNCKPGDLAVIVSARGSSGVAGEISAKCIGSIVRVVKIRPAESPTCTDAMVWEFEEPLLINHVGSVWTITGAADRVMLHIRPNEGADETLSWKEVPAGKPQEVEQC